MELFSVKGRVALVTGASGGIGAALATGLAAAGAELALNGRSAERLETTKQQIVAAGGLAESYVADVTDLDSVDDLVTRVLAQHGRIDILVNCAGMNRRQPIEDVTPEVYDQIMAANLRGLYFLTRTVVPSMRAHGSGKIIHIGSLTSTIGLADLSVYGMSKSALAQLTKTMAIEYAKDNIQVNCLCPGFIKTELTVPVWESPTRSKWMLERIPLARPGQPEDLVGMAILMASHASDYMTGQAVYVDGGFTAGSHW